MTNDFSSFEVTGKMIPFSAELLTNDVRAKELIFEPHVKLFNKFNKGTVSWPSYLEIPKDEWLAHNGVSYGLLLVRHNLNSNDEPLPFGY